MACWYPGQKPAVGQSSRPQKEAEDRETTAVRNAEWSKTQEFWAQSNTKWGMQVGKPFLIVSGLRHIYLNVSLQVLTQYVGMTDRKITSTIFYLCRYERWEVINKMWQQYADEVLRSAGKPEEAAMQLDLHGCHLRVARHRNGQQAGVEGIVVAYNDHVFHVVTQKDRCMHVARLKDCDFHIRLNPQQVAVIMT